MDNHIIKTNGLYYSYSGKETTLSDINMRVERGSIYGFLGPNGSGKTTTLSVLLGLLPHQQGSIRIFGQDIQGSRMAILKKVGSLIESPSLYSHLTARENLAVYRRIYGLPAQRIAEVLQTVGLAETAGKTVKKFSLGMKQRLAVALALLPRPELLILDEPTNGVDPAGIIELRELIKTLNRNEGMTILVSSHILAEMEKMVSHVGIICKGRILFQGPLREFQQNQSQRLEIHTSNNEEAMEVLKGYQPEKLEERIAVSIGSPSEVAEINRRLTQMNLDVYLLQPRQNDLEQLFINLTSHNK